MVDSFLMPKTDYLQRAGQDSCSIYNFLPVEWTLSPIAQLSAATIMEVSFTKTLHTSCHADHGNINGHINMGKGNILQDPIPRQRITTN